MDLLGRHPWRVLLLSALLLTACLLPEPRKSSSTPTSFDHSLHLKDGRLQCRNCHLLDQEGKGPTLPGPQLCRVCHADIDKDKPPERQVEAWFDADARFTRARVPQIPAELNFSHAAHNRNLSCEDCHGDMRTRQDLPPLVLSKDTCMDCHAQRRVENSCATCHKERGPHSKPDTHGLSFLRFHGEIVQAGLRDSPNRCELCHDQASHCDRCHHTRRPKDHTFHFRNRGHGLAASVDRERCATCHSPSSCETCHRKTPPRSHSAGWGGAAARHCGSCHLPLAAESCRTCHKATPGHQTATPLPPGHNPAMNCRLCHGAGAPLPHPDNGDTCTSCHR